MARETAAGVHVLSSNILLMTGDPESVVGAAAVRARAGMSADVYDAAARIELPATFTDVVHDVG